jgi:hypothetical protein
MHRNREFFGGLQGKQGISLKEQGILGTDQAKHLETTSQRAQGDQKGDQRLRKSDRLEPQVEWLSTDAQKPWPRNARTHFKRQINLIERFGFMNPILIDEEFRIIAGHGRWPEER